MLPLRVHIDVTNGTATPTQPDPQTVHLNVAQSQQQRKEMSLPRAGLRSPETADPPQTQSQWKEKPLLEAGSPAVGTASPPQISQERKEIPLPKTHPSPMGAADSSQIQPQRREMLLPRAGIQPLPSRRPLSQPPLCPVNSLLSLHCRLHHRVPPLLTPLVALGCYKQQTFLPRRLASFVATTCGLPRTSSSAPMTLYRPL